MNMRRIGRVLVLGLVSAGLSAPALAQAVMQSVTVQVAPGQMDAYLERIAALQGVMDRVGGGAQVSVWQATFAGAGTGTTLVSVTHPSLASYAETTGKTSADAEWQRVMAGLDDIRTIVRTSLLTSTDEGGVPQSAEAGAVLQGVIARPKPGQAAAYAAQLEKLKAVQKRLGLSGEMRAWDVTFGGEGSGNFAVGLVYPNLAALAAEQGKLQADPEGAALFASLDDLRTVVSVSLFIAD